MVEPSTQTANSVCEYETNRRVIKSMRKFTNSANAKCLLASTSMYAHNSMDGKVYILSAEQLIQGKASPAQEPDFGSNLPSMQSFESQTACADSTIVKVVDQHYLVQGFDDGVVCLLNLTKKKGCSIKRPVFKAGNSDASKLDDGVYTQWDEQSYEHADSIISVEANQAESTQAEPARVLTASKDGAIYVWSLGVGAPDEDKLVYVADVMLDEPLTKVRWLANDRILASTTHGNVYQLKLDKDD